MEYGPEFTALDFNEFRKTALPLIEAYKNTFRGNPIDVAEAKAALDAHCRAWYDVGGRKTAATRKALCDDMILHECYGG